MEWKLDFKRNKTQVWISYVEQKWQSKQDTSPLHKVFNGNIGFAL